MMDWKKTFCPLCYHNCGLEVQTEGHRITRVRAHKEHPRTKGYMCRKGARVAHYQDHGERLTHPLKREESGFRRISWEQAVAEIASRLRETLEHHGPRSLAYMGGGGQGCHMEAGFGRALLKALGSQYHYSPLAQELTGLFWVNGRAYGRQNVHLVPDLDRAENFLVIGWNGYVSNAGVNRARVRIDEFAADAHRRLIVVDPLRSETAKRADLHVPIRIGTAALFLKAMVATVLQQGWEDRAYLDTRCSEFDRVAPWFLDFDVDAACRVCGINRAQVEEVSCLYATRPTALRTDLGLLMDRQSTMNSYLEMLLMAVCGRIGTSGGNVFAGHVMPMGPHSDERDPWTWRTAETGIPAIMGYYPPNVVPEEILTEKAGALRAMVVSGSNPLISYADTGAYERALARLDLLVTIEVAMTETARMSHYVLPARSAFEKWDTTFFSFTYPEFYFQLRHPCCEPIGEQLEEGEIHTRLAEALGLLPDIPESLYAAARGDRRGFAGKLLGYLGRDQEAAQLAPFITARTLGGELGSAHLAGVWALLMRYPQHAQAELRGAGYEPDPLLGEDLFQSLLDHPEGILVGRVDPEAGLGELRTADKKIQLHIGELADWMGEITPEAEELALQVEDRPFVLVAGNHFPYVANSIMRDPGWNQGKTVCTLLINPRDAEELGIGDGGEAWVITEADRVKIPVEHSPKAAPKTVVIPHGFGMQFQGHTHGVNVNRLTRSTHRDRLAATPLHRYVPCRVEPA